MSVKITVKPNVEKPHLDEVKISVDKLCLTVIPKANMVISSLKLEDTEMLGQRAGLTGYVDKLSSFGFPFISPWMGRMTTTEYVFEDNLYTYSIDGLKVDENNYPMHGLLTANSDWTYKTVEEDMSASLVGTYVYDETVKGFEAFPFKHKIVLTYTLKKNGLEVVTEVTNMDNKTIPVAYGWHPLFKDMAIENISGIAEEIPLNSKCVPVSLEYSKAHPEDFDSTAKMYKMSEGWSVELSASFGNMVFTTSGYPYMLTWHPDNADYIAVEPMMSNIDPFNTEVTKLAVEDKLTTIISLLIK